ncbi:uncharacterized protein LOC126184215 [Schistocerca cancellata]|uniref:uncharacterized protein LOC126184215 n=1 Tax=Schistocerca cancellata TaxID=274614 RepID=UPI002117CD68|nr:uncharacterized protein LOC126184215 [Schistocerca cancellata]
MGGHCTSAIEVSQEKNGTCTCVYFKTHFGHELNIGFLHLSKSEREIIAGKIAEGVTFQRILDDVRDSIHCEEVERLHLLTRKDLHNIEKEFLIDPHQYHPSGEISFRVESLQSMQTYSTTILQVFSLNINQIPWHPYDPTKLVMG